MADKYLKHDGAGGSAEQEALVSSAGAGDAGKIPGLDGTGKLSTTMMPTGIGADTASVVTSESLVAGDYVNIYDVTGTATARKADATVDGKEAHGFVLTGVTSPEAVLIYFEGNNDQVTLQTAGKVYLSTTPGVGTATPPSATGNIVQQVGVAHSATGVNFEASKPITLA
ncbi:MAG: hypothetical protein PF440_11580 [Thiomicrorhabdus sp.]|jgi:hypothetical protein|nr:hypothetical protein [Thiomicrorhabdus sp.]